MDSEYFYILIQNRPYRRENYNNDYHIERIYSIDQVMHILNDDIVYDDHKPLAVLVTDNKPLINKFVVVISEDELKTLCGITQELKTTKINPSFFERLSNEVYSYYCRVKNDGIVSASMVFSSSTIYPYDDPTIGISTEDYQGWEENSEFSYFKTPSRYLKENSYSDIFYLHKLGKIKISSLNKFLNIDILKIGTDDRQHLNWELRNGYLRYYDKNTSVRFYITNELLNKIKISDDPYNLEIDTITKLDANHYIEYYTQSIVSEHAEDDHNEFFENEGEQYSYDKYNGAYGFDDDTIDSAFEGDPENYWNID